MTTEIILAGVLGWILGMITMIALAYYAISSKKGKK